MKLEPVYIFPWQRPFLPDLKNFIDQKGGAPIIIVPNNRPWRYFEDLYKREKKARLLPKMFAYSDLIKMWNPAADRVLNELDQIYLLYDCIQQLARSDKILAATFANMDMARFFPWGMRLASLLEDIFTNGVEAQDLLHLDHEVEQPAANLLAAIGRISTAWKNKLLAENWSTPGFAQYQAQLNASAIPARIRPLEQRPVYIAGFYTLNGAQEKLFKSLWQNGAQLCWHTDPQLLMDKNIHWSCLEHEWLLKRWQANAEFAYKPTEEDLEKSPVIHFFNGYDAHSQLLKLRADLRNNKDDSTAVVLSNPALLLPVLHHFHEHAINISMGYPLLRSALANLFREIFTLVERAQIKENAASLYYWQDLLKIFNQPYLKMFSANSSLKNILNAISAKIRCGKKYVQIDTLLDNMIFSSQDRALLNEIIDLFIEGPAKNRTLHDLALSLANICNFLIKHNIGVDEKNTLDSEVINRLITTAIPILSNNELAKEEFSLPVLHNILWTLFENERVPFEADPLVGTQILGMLETRLLQFDNLFIMDATSDCLPGNPSQNPLLPDPLRSLLGLPDEKTRQGVIAHTFFRLLAGAKNASIFWQTGHVSKGIFDMKKDSSPFVQELIWRAEQEEGKVFKPGEMPWELAKCDLQASGKEIKSLKRSAQIEKSLNNFLLKNISPSSLDVYLTCPYKFALQCLMKFKEIEEVNEGEDPPLLGKAIHKALEKFYTPYVNKDFAPDKDSPKILQNLFEKELSGKDIQNLFPVDSFLMLNIAAPRQFNKYFGKQKRSRIKAVEATIKAKFKFFGKAYAFEGRIDRLDEREGKKYILDYKTGKLKDIDEHIWTDEEFFKKIENYCDEDVCLDEHADKLIVELQDRLKSVQLPCYIAMLRENGECNIGNAAIIDLHDSCEEKPLFKNMDDAAVQKALTFSRLTLKFVMRHLSQTREFKASHTDKCSWCQFADICKL